MGLTQINIVEISQDTEKTIKDKLERSTKQPAQSGFISFMLNPIIWKAIKISSEKFKAINRKGKEVEINEGDYLLFGVGGELYTCSRDKFNKDYYFINEKSPGKEYSND